MKRTGLAPSPFLLLLASLSFIYVQSSFVASVDQVIRPMLVICCVLFLLAWPIHRFTRNWDLTSAMLIVIVLGFFSSSYIANVAFASMFVIAMILFLILRPLKRKLTLRHLFVIVNILSVTAIFLCVSWLFGRLKRIPASYYENLAHRKDGYALRASDAEKPDIYYIVLDGYGRSDVLQEFYSYDNSPFTNQLREYGFVLPEHGHSNYPKTALSITSTLNMDYIDSFAPDLKNTGFWWLMSPWIDQSRVRTSLENIGYTTVSISTDWSVTDNQTTDIYMQSHPIILNDFEKYFFSSTPLALIQPRFQNIMSVPTFDMHRQTQLYNFSALTQLAKIPGPKFVFAHIILPHPPFVFAADGTPTNPNYGFGLRDAKDLRETHLQYQEQYIAQVRFLNGRLKPVLEAILRDSARPPVIILQADHGPGMMMDSSSPARSCLKERFSSFSAYYFPGVDKKAIPENITPVNLFRIVFNEYFDADLPLLTNVSYFPADPIGIYAMTDVTQSVESSANCDSPGSE